MTPIAYEFEAVTRAGLVERGVAEAPTQAQAYRELLSRGLSPVWIRPRAARRAGGRRRRLRPSELSEFTNQLGVLLGAGVPLTEVLASIADQGGQGLSGDLARDLSRRVQSGEALSSALRPHREVVGEVYVETMAAAERSGNLVAALEQMCESLERSEQMVRAVRGALMYPACVVLVLVLAGGFLIGFIVPKFTAMFARRGVDLPLLTRLLGEVGTSLQSWWWAYLVGVVAAVVVGGRARRLPAVAGAIEGVLHRIPVVAPLLVGLAVSRFSRVLGMGLSSGLRLVEALELAGRASGRRSMRAEASRLADQVRAGGLLAEQLRACRYLTPLARRLLTSGERAGQLGQMCDVVARFYDRRVLGLAKGVSTVIEPVLVVLIAGLVLTIALAIFLPMWDMVKLVG